VRHAVSFAENKAGSVTGFMVAFLAQPPDCLGEETVVRNVEIRRPSGIVQVLKEIKSCA
jgi:hypothetical protein